MGCETIAKIRGHITPEEIINYIRVTIDKNVSYNIKTDDYGNIDDTVNHGYIKNVYDDSEIMNITSGFINFTTISGNKKSMFYFYQNVATEENIEYYKRTGLAEIAETQTTTLMVSADNEAVEILTKIVSMYGGWLDENDCDEEKFYKILKSSDPLPVKIIHVTMEELNKMYGGVVVIDG